ncbi:ABC transporter substrate-binding protein [Mesorhizobium sp. M0195]
MSLLTKTMSLAAAAAMAVTLMSSASFAEDGTGQQLYPLFTYRTGPYAPSFIPFGAGNIDYLPYINEVEGGVDGVKILVQECETAYTIERGIECYERYKNGYNGYPHSSGLDVALTDKARIDKIPIVSPGGGPEHRHRRSRLSLPVSAGVRLLERSPDHRRLHRPAGRRL